MAIGVRENTMRTIITEAKTPSEQAKSMNPPLVYVGFAGWASSKDPNRKVVAKTIDGKLVRVDDDDEETKGKKIDPMTQYTIIDLDEEFLKADKRSPAREKYIALFKHLINAGDKLIILTARGSDERAAAFLKEIGITNNVKLIPYGSAEPEKKKKLVNTLIKDGARHIRYFDRDPHAVSAVEGLKATFNRAEIDLDTHTLAPFQDVEYRLLGKDAKKKMRER